jgi:iron complex outermembrane receptor protein
MRTHLSRLLCGLLLSAAISSAPVAAETGHRTGATPAQQHFAIPAQDLATALLAYGQTSGSELLYDTRLVQGLRSSELAGTYAPEEALSRLLHGTGLQFRLTASGTVTLERAAQPGTEPKASHPVSTSKAASTALPEMTVTAKAWQETGYTVSDALTATKTDTPIMETPLNIQVVPQQVIRDQQAFTLSRILQNVSGVLSDPNNIDGSAESIYVRGFVTSDTYRNGVRMNASATGQVGTANVDKVEVLKGPAAILYGRIEPGGLVNVVTKQPLATPYYSLQQQFGSFNLFRTSADATGPVTRDDTLLYRVNFSYEKADSFKRLVNNNELFLAPVLRLLPTSAPCRLP